MQIELFKGDITKVNADAIVNAANKTLLGGGGVDGAIHRAAGKDLLTECRSLNGCETGEAKITAGYALDAKHIIHTVGPVWKDGKHNESELLLNCYENSMKLADHHALKSIAFPNISTGVYRFPKKEAAKIAINAIAQYKTVKTSVEKVVFVVFDEDNFNIYNDLLKEII